MGTFQVKEMKTIEPPPQNISFPMARMIQFIACPLAFSGVFLSFKIRCKDLVHLKLI